VILTSYTTSSGLCLDLCEKSGIAGFVKPTFKLFSQQQGQKTAKHMTPDRIIALMKYRPDVHQYITVFLILHKV
jgi:hypothetical protein